MKIRVGFGFDVHQLVPGRELWLGGIKFEHELGLLLPTCVISAIIFPIRQVSLRI